MRHARRHGRARTWSRQESPPSHGLHATRSTTSATSSACSSGTPTGWSRKCAYRTPTRRGRAQPSRDAGSALRPGRYSTAGAACGIAPSGVIACAPNRRSRGHPSRPGGHPNEPGAATESRVRARSVRSRASHTRCRRSAPGSMGYVGRTSTKPAAAKSWSNASASRSRRSRITRKLVASTKECSRSSCRRSHSHAPDS